MGFPTGIGSTGRRIYVTAIIFMLHLQLSSTGDDCPPENQLDHCTCFQASDVKGPFRTTQKPIVLALSKTSEESVVQERIEGVNIKNTDETVEITSTKPLPPNATCCTIVSCNAPKSLLILEDTIQNALNRKWVDKLIISNLPPEKERTLVRLPTGFLKPFRVKHFEIRDTLLSGDFIYYGVPFEGQDQSMLWFTARNCYLGGSLTYDTVGTVHTRGLNYLPRIEGVDFSRNHFVHIASSGFRNPPGNLTTINLSYNSIQSIESGSFNHCPNLKKLDLSHNLLETIARNIMASPARKLEHIDLSWNQLKVLPNDFFVNLPQLKVAVLRNNFLTSLPNQLWGPIWKQLTFVDVEDNFILCDCSLKWLVPTVNPTQSTAVSTTSSPIPPHRQFVFGSCSYVKPNTGSKLYRLNSLLAPSLNC